MVPTTWSVGASFHLHLPGIAVAVIRFALQPSLGTQNSGCFNMFQPESGWDFLATVRWVMQAAAWRPGSEVCRRSRLTGWWKPVTQ